MTSIITGDIINSRILENPDDWIVPLKELFALEGPSPETWDIYRGDSFQIEVKQPEEVFFLAIRIKATIKSIKDLDVRMAIGIGEKNYSAAKITESNGEAFIHSGEQLEIIKKEKQTLAIKSPWPDFDKEINVSISLALIAMDRWKRKTAEFVKVSLENPNKGQQEIAELMGIKQSAVSQSQKRAHLTEIMEFESLFREKINQRIQTYDPVL